MGETEQSLPSLPARLGGPENRQMRAAEGSLSAVVDLVIKCPTKARTLQGPDSSKRKWIFGLWEPIKGMV